MNGYVGSTRIGFPDPLVWQSGIEFGIQACASVVHHGYNLEIYVPCRGPMLEAVVCAFLEFKLQDRVRWVRSSRGAIWSVDAVVFPRVSQIKPDLVGMYMKSDIAVFASDPLETLLDKCRVYRFEKRNWLALAGMMLAWLDSVDVDS